MIRLLLVLLALALFPGCGGRGSSSDDGAPSAPSVRVVNNRVLLSWTAGSGLPDGYLVEESTDAANWTQVASVTEAGAYIDGLSNGTTYYFRVRAYNSAGNSAYSGSSSISL